MFGICKIKENSWMLIPITISLIVSLPVSGALSQEINGIKSQKILMLEVSKEGVARITKIMEKWITSGEVTEDRLFARLYYPMLDPNSKVPKLVSDPPKFTTDYDKLADRDIKPVEDELLAKSPDIVFVVVVDINGYLPSHNTRYSQALTGDLQTDLVNNRTKRIFCDRTGLQAARNTNTYLIQSYKRDTGETMNDLSMPIYIKGKHWGALRIGYRVN